MNFKDLGLGIVSILFAAFILIENRNYKILTNTGEWIPGAGFFPLIVGTSFVFLGITELLWSVLGESTKNTQTRFKDVINILVLLAVMILYVYLLGRVNFIIATFLFLLISSIILGAKVYTSFIFSLVSSILVFILFEHILGVSLP